MVCGGLWWFAVVCGNPMDRLHMLESLYAFYFVLPYVYIHGVHHLNIFLEKAVKLSKHDFFLVKFLKRDKVVTIYSKFRFDYH